MVEPAEELAVFCCHRRGVGGKHQLTNFRKSLPSVRPAVLRELPARDSLSGHCRLRQLLIQLPQLRPFAPRCREGPMLLGGIRRGFYPQRIPFYQPPMQLQEERIGPHAEEVRICHFRDARPRDVYRAFISCSEPCCQGEAPAVDAPWRQCHPPCAEPSSGSWLRALLATGHLLLLVLNTKTHPSSGWSQPCKQPEAGTVLRADAGSELAAEAPIQRPLSPGRCARPHHCLSHAMNASGTQQAFTTTVAAPFGAK